MILNLTCAQLDELINEGKFVIIDLYATWCGPCKMLAPIFERVAEANADKAVFAKVDIDEVPDMAERFNVQHVPTVIAIKNGEVIHHSEGIMNEPALRALVENNA